MFGYNGKKVSKSEIFMDAVLVGLAVTLLVLDVMVVVKPDPEPEETVSE